MSHYGQVTSQTPTQERTRLAIVAASIETWAEDRNATLAQIAAAAGMGRSTVHRYFADRDELLAAVDRECRRRFGLATQRARPGDGAGLEACHRLCEEYLGLGPVLGLIFSDNALIDPDSWSGGDGTESADRSADDESDDDESDDDPFVQAVIRGQRDGSVDAQLPVGWASTTLWMLLYSAWLYLTTEHASRRDVAALLTRTVAGAIGRPASNGSR
jgi:TetR/AcrR family transcriptional repressor of lfrA